VGESPLFYCSECNSGVTGTIMANRTAITDQILAIAERVGASEGIEIVNVELVGGGGSRVLRITIDRAPGARSSGGETKPEGVTHADCEFITQQVGTILDIEDVIPGGSYRFEVTSPGLDRKLTRPRDFERFVGHRVKVALREPVENQRHWVGALKGFAEGIVTLEPAPGRSIQFPLEQVERANLKFEW
jgi:ribosome maturation factor RimP